MPPTINEQALSLARANKQAEPGIVKIFWFPDEQEIRLVELEKNMPATMSGNLEPFYFAPSPADGLFAPTAIALIRPEEYQRLLLPAGWVDWLQAQELPV